MTRAHDLKPAPANDVLLFMPRTLRLDRPLHRAVQATLHDDGLVVAGDVQVRAEWHVDTQTGRPIASNWLVRLCEALLAAGVAGSRPLVVRRRDRGPVCSCLSISETALAGRTRA